MTKPSSTILVKDPMMKKKKMIKNHSIIAVYKKIF